MKHQKGFSLLEIILSLIIFSILMIGFLKWKQWECHQHAILSEEENVLAYMNAFWHFLETNSMEWPFFPTQSGEIKAIWYGFQDGKTKERKFFSEKPKVYRFRVEMIVVKKDSDKKPTGRFDSNKVRVIHQSKVAEEKFNVVVKFYGQLFSKPLGTIYRPRFLDAKTIDQYFIHSSAENSDEE